MTIHIHHLTGCSPTPLAYYLKALGILRLIAEQKDPNARGWWQDEAFHLASTLSRNELEYFFLEEYAPTPIIDPWNGGSGFYPNDKKAGITFLLNSLAPRFSSYQSAIRDGIDLVGNRKDAPKKTEKERMLTNARQLWRGPRLEMMAAAIVLTANGSPAYAALCGTGWNDGRLDFANNFMQRVADLYEGSSGKPKKHSVQLLDCAMWMLPVNGLSKKIAIGQYLPGGAGGANSTTGPDGDSLVNPWDFILMLEGAVLFSASVVGRTTLKAPSAAAAPFSIHPAASGFASASKAEEDSPRGEQWMPIWNQPSTLMDLKLLMADGRARLGRATASRPVDFARAVARLGVARGIVSFQRFGYLERNGQSNLAVPLGRWQVCPQPQQDLLNDLDTWLSPLQRACREKNAPASLGYAHRRLENAILGVCAHGSEASRWQVVLLGLADIEQQLVTSGKFTTEKRLQPILPLSAGWIDAANDGSPEFRLARSLALQAADEYGNDSIRRHWLPLDKLGRRFATDASGLRKDPRVVCYGFEPERDLLALVQRRLVEGAKGAATRLPLVSAPGCAANLPDIAALLAGDVDLTLVVNLARAFMAINRRTLSSHPSDMVHPSQTHDELPPLYGLFRLACLPWPLRRGEADISIRCDPTIVGRLASGDLRGAGDTALRRLKAAGLSPVIRHVTGDTALARRLAVSLTFPVFHRDAARLADRLTKSQTHE